MAKNKIEVSILAETQGIRKGVEDVNRQLDGMNGKFSKVGSAVKGAFLAAGAAVVASGVGNFLKDSITAASDLNETLSKTEVLFGKGAGEIVKFAEGAATSLGQTKQQALDAAANFATFGKAAGLSGNKLNDFAITNTKLASDLASFNNTTPEQAIEALGAAFRGEAEPLRQYGVLLDDATLRNEALKLGLVKTTKEALTPQQKVLAAQSAIMKQTGAAQGDFARTSGGLANQQRILSAQFENLKGTVGAAFLPIVLKVVSFLNNNLMPAFGKVKDVIDLFTAGITLSGDQAKEFGDDLTGLIKFGAQVREVFDRVKTGFMELVAGFTLNRDEAKSLGEDLTGLVRIGSNIRDIFDRVKNGVLELVAGFTLQRQEAKDMAGDLTGLVQTGSVLRDYFELIKNMVMQVVAAFVNNWSKIAPLVSSIFNSVKEIIGAVVGIVTRQIQIFVAVVSVIWNKWGNDILKFVIKVFNGILTTIAGVLKVVAGVVKLVLAVLKGDWSGAWSAIKQIVSGALQVIKGAVQTSMAVIKGVFSAGWAIVKETVGRAIGAVINTVTGIHNKVVGALRGAGSWLVQAGRDLVSGLINGIKQMASRAASAAVDVVNDAINAAKRKLGINSPSRVFRGIGVNVVAGLVEGLGNTRPVTRAAGELALATAGGYSARVGSSMSTASSRPAMVQNNYISTLDTKSTERVLQDLMDNTERRNGRR